jgi:tetratricopeptide (TPR) repeat protein
MLPNRPLLVAALEMPVIRLFFNLHHRAPLLAWFVFLIVCLSFRLLVAAPIPADKIAGLEGKKYPDVDKAVAKFTSGDIEQARELLEVAAMRNPELPPAGVMLARLLFATNQVPRGRAELERAVLVQPDDPEAYEAIGNLAISEGRFTEAGLVYRQVDELVEKMPSDSPRKKNLALRAQAGLATVAEARNNWDEAVGHLQQWIKLDENDFRPHVRLGQVLFRLNKPDEAFAELERAAKLSDQAPVPGVLMGRFYQQAGDEKKAGEYMAQALAQSPEDPVALVGVAEWSLEVGKLADAKKYADMALRIKPDSVEAKLVRGLIARFENDYTEAEKQFESAHLLAPANLIASNQLALVLSQQDDATKLRRATELAELNARQFANSVDAQATLAAVYLKAGRTDEAERVLTRIVNAGQPITGDIAYYMAQLLVRRDRSDEAKRWLRIALDSKGPFANRQAAQALFDQLNKKS